MHQYVKSKNPFLPTLPLFLSLLSFSSLLFPRSASFLSHLSFPPPPPFLSQVKGIKESTLEKNLFIPSNLLNSPPPKPPFHPHLPQNSLKDGEERRKRKKITLVKNGGRWG